MTSATDQYRTYVEQSQQAFTAAVDTWTRTVEETVASLPRAAAPVDPQQVVDQVFDFVGQLLQMQRELTRQLLATSAAASPATQPAHPSEA